jgi:hypothetical protein
LRNSGTGGGGSNDTVITKFPLYSISGSPHDSIAVYGVDSSIQLVTAVNDSLLRFTRFNGTTFDVPVIGGAGGGGGGSGTVTNVATGYGLSGGPITTTGTLLVDTASSIASKTYVDNKDALLVTTTSDQTLVSTSAQTAFTFTGVPSSYADYLIFVNGMEVENTEYFTTLGNIVTFTTGLITGDRVRFKRIK